jgi:DNA-binding XRE family transcriptional regulator
VLGEPVVHISKQISSFVPPRSGQFFQGVYALDFDRDHFGDLSSVGITEPFGLMDRVVFAEHVFRKPNFGLGSVAFVTPGASRCLSVSNDPHSSAVQGEARAFVFARHRCGRPGMAITFVRYIEVLYIEQWALLPEMDLREIFATNLRRLRNAKGLSQDDLAYEAKMSRSYLSQLEKGSFYVSIKVIGKLADTLGVEPEEFLKLSGKRRSRN